MTDVEPEHYPPARMLWAACKRLMFAMGDKAYSDRTIVRPRGFTWELRVDDTAVWRIERTDGRWVEEWVVDPKDIK